MSAFRELAQRGALRVQVVSQPVNRRWSLGQAMWNPTPQPAWPRGLRSAPLVGPQWNLSRGRFDPLGQVVYLRLAAGRGGCCTLSPMIRLRILAWAGASVSLMIASTWSNLSRASRAICSDTILTSGREISKAKRGSCASDRLSEIMSFCANRKKHLVSLLAKKAPDRRHAWHKWQYVLR